MRHIYILQSRYHDIYYNLALEEYLFHQVKQGEQILFLWSNSASIVIGKNQNIWRECRVGIAQADGVHIARRMSGGGAVYQDEGNLNYSFLCMESDYSLSEQQDILIQALRECGIHAVRSGRNDLIDEDGCKISGEAYRQKGARCLHHGTILHSVDLQRMERYLSVSREKLHAKSLESVRSRVANLTDHNLGLTMDRLVEAIGKQYQKMQQLPVENVKEPAIGILQDQVIQLRSKEWIYGRKHTFSWEMEHRFDWGEIQLALEIEKGNIRTCRIYTDSLSDEWLAQTEQMLAGTEFDMKKICERIEYIYDIGKLGEKEKNALFTIIKKTI